MNDSHTFHTALVISPWRMKYNSMFELRMQYVLHIILILRNMNYFHTIYHDDVDQDRPILSLQ